MSLQEVFSFKNTLKYIMHITLFITIFSLPLLSIEFITGLNQPPNKAFWQAYYLYSDVIFQLSLHLSLSLTQRQCFTSLMLSFFTWMITSYHLVIT